MRGLFGFLETNVDSLEGMGFSYTLQGGGLSTSVTYPSDFENFGPIGELGKGWKADASATTSYGKILFKTNLFFWKD